MLWIMFSSTDIPWNDFFDCSILWLQIDLRLSFSRAFLSIILASNTISIVYHLSFNENSWTLKAKLEKKPLFCSYQAELVVVNLWIVFPHDKSFPGCVSLAYSLIKAHDHFFTYNKWGGFLGFIDFGRAV